MWMQTSWFPMAICTKTSISSHSSLNYAIGDYSINDITDHSADYIIIHKRSCSFPSGTSSLGRGSHEGRMYLRSLMLLI